MRKIRTIADSADLFTLGNLICGFFSIVVASRVAAPRASTCRRRIASELRSPANLAFDKEDPTHNIMLSGWLIFLAMVFDALDGHVARLSRTSSDFGAQLDSLCDVVTFGVAPGFLLVKMVPEFTYLHPGRDLDHRGGLSGLRGDAAGAVQRRDERRRRSHALQRAAEPRGAASIAGFAILFYTTRIESQYEG